MRSGELKLRARRAFDAAQAEGRFEGLGAEEYVAELIEVFDGEFEGEDWWSGEPRREALRRLVAGRPQRVPQ